MITVCPCNWSSGNTESRFEHCPVMGHQSEDTEARRCCQLGTRPCHCPARVEIQATHLGPPSFRRSLDFRGPWQGPQRQLTGSLACLSGPRLEPRGCRQRDAMALESNGPCGRRSQLGEDG